MAVVLEMLAIIILIPIAVPALSVMLVPVALWLIISIERAQERYPRFFAPICGKRDE